MVKIKVCGLTNVEDAKASANLGVDFIGFVFAESPRHIKKEEAKKIICELPGTVKKAGVFVNEELGIVEDIANFCGLDVLQFHGEEDPDYCLHFMEQKEVFKAFRLKDKDDIIPIQSYRVSAYLLDTFVEGLYGGTGKTFNWQLAVEVKKFGCPIVLSGGLNAKNVGEVIRKVHPEIVDVSSGVEAVPGKKDPEKLREFVENVRAIG